MELYKNKISNFAHNFYMQMFLFEYYRESLRFHFQLWPYSFQFTFSQNLFFPKFPVSRYRALDGFVLNFCRLLFYSY